MTASRPFRGATAVMAAVLKIDDYREPDSNSARTGRGARHGLRKRPLRQEVDTRRRIRTFTSVIPREAIPFDIAMK